MMEAPWSRAAPVKLCTRCSKLSRDLAGLEGALVPRWAGPLPKLSDSSGPPVGGAEPGGTGPPGDTDPAVPGAGGGGMLGGPPGIGCC